MTPQEYQRRRQALLTQMQPGSAALIFAAPEVTRSADSEYPYRQNSDFWYFTGFNEPEAVLVLIKSNDTHNHSVLFNRVRDLTAEIWFGRRLGQDAAPEKLGVDRALAFSEINQQLFQLLNGLDVVYHAQGEYAYADEIVFTALEKLRKGSRQNLKSPSTMTDWRPMVHEMRLIKSPEEIAVMRRAGEITALAHTRAMEKCRPACLNTNLKVKFITNLIVTARVTRRTTPLWVAGKTAAFSITPKMNVRCAMAIWYSSMQVVNTKATRVTSRVHSR